MRKLAEPHLLSLETYVPGRAIENNSEIPFWAKLASNENCLGPSKAAMEGARKSLHQSHLYPNATRLLLVSKICQHLKEYKIQPNQIALGNGTSELIVNLTRGLLAPEEVMLYAWPTFVMYPQAAQAFGRKSIAVPLKDDFTYDIPLMIKQCREGWGGNTKLIFLANPNNPTGKYLTGNELRELVGGIPKDVVLVIDEAYAEYVADKEYPNGLRYALERPRTVVLRTFSKVYGLAGLRLGYAVGDSEVIEILCRMRDPFNVNSVAQHAAIAALEDQEHVKNSIKHNAEHKPILLNGLRDFGFSVVDGACNFLLAKRNQTMPSAQTLSDRLLVHGVIIRPLKPFGLADFVRVSVGTKDEISHLFRGLKAVMAEK